MRDEVDKDDAPVRLVFEPKSRNQDRPRFANLLLSHTSLETSASINLVMIGLDGRPGRRTSPTSSTSGAASAGTVRRRTASPAWARVNDRIHILEAGTSSSSTSTR